MTRDDWECSSGPWQAQNRRSTLIGKAILDPDCPIRRHPTRSHGLACNPCDGNSSRRSLSCNNRSSCLRFTTLALSSSRSPNRRSSFRLHHDETDEGGISPLRLRRLRLADSPTLLLQRCNLRPHSILPSHTLRIPHNDFDSRTNPSRARSLARWRPVLLTPEPSQNTIPFVR